MNGFEKIASSIGSLDPNSKGAIARYFVGFSAFGTIILSFAFKELYPIDQENFNDSLFTGAWTALHFFLGLLIGKTTQVVTCKSHTLIIKSCQDRYTRSQKTTTHQFKQTIKSENINKTKALKINSFIKMFKSLPIDQSSLLKLIHDGNTLTPNNEVILFFIKNNYIEKEIDLPFDQAIFRLKNIYNDTFINEWGELERKEISKITKNEHEHKFLSLFKSTTNKISCEEYEAFLPIISISQIILFTELQDNLNNQCCFSLAIKYGFKEILEKHLNEEIHSSTVITITNNYLTSTLHQVNNATHEQH